jgi:hypothetical protein
MNAPRREIRAFKGYDRRNEPGGYGIGGVSFWFILRRGPLAISWELLTEMFPPTVQTPRRGETAAAVTAHSPNPIDGWEGPGKCELVPGGQCYSTRGYLVGDDVKAALIAGGSDGAFDRMGEILTSWLKGDDE